MSRMSRDARKLAFAGLATAAALGAGASSAQAAKLSLNYQCKYPLIGAQPLKVDIDAAIPSTWAVNKLTNPFTISVSASAGGSTAKGLQLIGVRSLEGVAQADASLITPDGFDQDLSVPIAITNWSSSTATLTSPINLKATGVTPPVLFDTKGNAKVTVDKLQMNLTARNASGQALPLQPVTTDLDGKAITPADSNPATFDVPCKLDPASQSTKLADITVNDSNQTSSDTTAPSTPGTVSVSTTATSATLNWGASNDNVGVVAYDILKDGAVYASSASTSISLPELAPSSTTNWSVVARDANNNTSTPRAFTVNTPAENVATNAIAKYNAGLTGTASMRTLITGNLPLEGSIAADMTVADGKYTADLNLLPRTGRLNALGFLPVTARVGFTNAAKTAGDLSNAGVLTATAKLRIKLLEVKLFGALPIAGGNNCQTKQISTIVLKSKPNFDPVVGGAISGTFSISDLNDCGFLTGIVSPLTAGGGNQINATLKPQI